ncbi:hypothetical protein [Actinoplanes sp. NPDC049265]|uniref:hypothetical protein n=1 Tax=Actinoplanes sp. NPDC049265 TaxID=3363902 RepID=UPI00371140E1
MRFTGRRVTALVAGSATVAALALTGCSAGQVAETAMKKPSNSGVNASNSNNSVVVRNLQAVYNGVEGYAPGTPVPLEVALFNQTTEQVVVTISSRPLSGAAPSQGAVAAGQIGITGGPGAASASAAAEPSGSRPPASPDTETPDNVPSGSASGGPAVPPPAPGNTPQLQPARITIGAMGSASFMPGDSSQLLATGITSKVTNGQAINLVFEFSNGAQPLELQAPVGVPMSAAPRGSADPAENEEPEGGE